MKRENEMRPKIDLFGYMVTILILFSIIMIAFILGRGNQDLEEHQLNSMTELGFKNFQHFCEGCGYLNITDYYESDDSIKIECDKSKFVTVMLENKTDKWGNPDGVYEGTVHCYKTW